MTHDVPSLPIPIPRAAYLHVPFCLHRCGYCDFTLVAGQDHLIAAYLTALERQLESLGTPREVDTLFFGGGTPTHLAPEALARLLDLARKWFPLAEGYELTVEANPFGLDDERIEVLASRGVNRISLGVQAFDDEILRCLERDHRRPDIERTFRRLRPAFGNISLDLIFGVPGQTLALWDETLAEAVALGPEHLSTYGLTFERGTRFWARREKGDLLPAAEELERQMYARVMDRLTAAGYEQYEISSFARPGFRCRHNEVYWAGRPYYAFGPGAASYLDGQRRMNHRSVATWLKRIEASASPIADEESLAGEAHARELVFLGLRRTAGIDLREFAAQTGYELEALGGDALPRHLAAGLVERTPTHIRLTREGRFVADMIVADFL